MVQDLFKYRSVRERHRRAPFLEERERYLEHKAAQGCSHLTLIRIARELLCISRSFDREGNAPAKDNRRGNRDGSSPIQ
jgi:hypothetical protein